MGWYTRVGDSWRSSDDLTLDELAAIEKVSGVGWAYINPFVNTDTARALLAAWHVRDGETDEVAQKSIAALTAKTLKHTFRHVEDDDLPDNWEDGLPVNDDPKEKTSTAGS